MFDPVAIRKVRVDMRQSPDTDLYYAKPSSSLPKNHPLRNLMVVGKSKAELLSIIPDVIRDFFIAYARISVLAKLRDEIVKADGWMEYVFDIYGHGTYCPNAKGDPGSPGEPGDPGIDK